MKNAGIISGNGTINAVINGAQYTLPSESKFYQQALAAFKVDNWEGVAEACDFDKKLRQKSDGKVTCENGAIRYNGAIVSNKLSDRILRMLDEGFSCEPLMRFMENCFQNPNPTVVDRLYDFMSNTCILLDDDGYVVGYKKVRDDYFDFYSGTVKYEVGTTVVMPREKCNEDSRNTCAASLHTGSRNYAENLWHKGEGRILLVRIHPKNVVTVPEEQGWEKLRSCEIEVVKEITQDIKEGAKFNTVYSTPKLNSPRRDSHGRFIKGATTTQKRDSNGRFC